MIKYLEVPDLHYSANRGETLQKISNVVADAALKNEVDFIALPGDLYHAPIMATDKGGINQLIRIVRKWTAICPVVAIEGTPSHDGPGCYGPLEDAGLMLLQPGRVYGFTNLKDKSKKIFNIDEVMASSEDWPEAVLFGIPELNKKNILSRLNVSAEQANAEAVNLFNRYVAEYLAPMRLKYSDIPAICLFHGNVSDASKSNENDIILKASDIVLHTEAMQIANIDRWSLGHIHKPWESSKICAGYGGSWGKDWTETGFLPCFNLIEIKLEAEEILLSSIQGIRSEQIGEKHQVTLTRIPYGTPARKKIIHPINNYDSGVAYLLETDDETAGFIEGGVHPWSEIRIKAKPKESRRVDPEQVAAAKGLRDLMKLFDPDIPESVLKKIDEITENVRQHEIKPIDVQMQEVRIEGAGAFFNDDNICIDFTQIDGVTELHGAGNGVGKSSLLAFCSPYPVVIGKDTRSGRPSAIKDFFDKPESNINKKLYVNGVLHEHKITIKAAHTQTPKVECYLTIDGISQLERGTFDEMMEECEKIYGPYLDYFYTTFYVQPLQGKTGSSLMSAGMVDIRNLVQAIAGIDRESEKQYALDMIKKLEIEIKDLTAWLTGAQEFQVDVSELEKESAVLEMDFGFLTGQVDKKLQEGKAAKTDLDKLQADKQKSDAEKTRKEQDEAAIKKIDVDIIHTSKNIEQLRQLSDTVADNKKILESDDLLIKNNLEAEKILTQYDNLKSSTETEINKLQGEHNRIKDEKLSGIKLKENQNKSAEEIIQRIKKPCEHCGKVPYSEVEKEIKEHDRIILNGVVRIKELNTELSELSTTGIDEMRDQLSTLIKPIAEIKDTLDAVKRLNIEDNIKSGMEAEASIKSYNEKLIALNHDRSELEKASKYEIDEQITIKVSDASDLLSGLRSQYTNLEKEKATKEAEIKAISDQITKAQEEAEKIKESENKSKALTLDLYDWQYAGRNLQSSKLPAFELEMFLDGIDIEASKIIEPYLNARFSFSTQTQSTGKKSIVDRFDIRVHDCETGKEKSFIEFNPGTKAFLNDAYVKALVKCRNNRFNRNYSPVIIDEADEPIHPSMIECFYTIQSEYWQDSKVIIVSHNPASHEHIGNMVVIDDLKYRS